MPRRNHAQRAQVIGVIHTHRRWIAGRFRDHGSIERFAKQGQFSGLHVFKSAPHELVAEVSDPRILARYFRVDGPETLHVKVHPLIAGVRILAGATRQYSCTGKLITSRVQRLVHALHPARMRRQVRPSRPHHCAATARPRLRGFRVPIRVRHAVVAVSSGIAGLLPIRLRTKQRF